MTLGDDRAAEKKVEDTPQTSEFSPAEVVPHLADSPTDRGVIEDGGHSLQWSVSSVQDKEMDKS
eukprot:3330425-Rhodomonas_salina.1